MTLETQFPPQAFVLMEVADERERQDEKWGGPDHDDQHHTRAFIGFIDNYAGAARLAVNKSELSEARRRLIQVAALAVAAVESLDRKMEGGTSVKR